MESGFRIRTVAAVLIVLTGMNVACAENAAGQWMGVLGGSDTIVLRVSKSPDGQYSATIANLQQSGRPLSADDLAITDTRISLGFKPLNGHYDARWNAPGATWQGTWSQNGLDRPLNFKRASDAEIAAHKLRRPQDEAVAKGPRPYIDHEITFENTAAHVKLAGTLSVPNGKGPFPAVLMIAAAGRVSRDENAGGHLVFVVLADHLLRHGIATLRYDKRGVGNSTGDFASATFSDLLADATAGFHYLEARPEIDRHRTGVLGHSEGGSLAPAVATIDPDVAFVVAMAGSGLSGEFRICENRAFMMREAGAAAEQAEKVRTLCQKIFAAVAATPDNEVADRKIESMLNDAVAQKLITAPYAAGTRELLSAKAVREWSTDDPIEYLRKVKAPVLAIVGSLDRTVPAEPYVTAMRPVIATIPGSQLQVLPQLNHVMQTAQTGSPREFGVIEETIAPLALNTITDFIARQMQR